MKLEKKNLGGGGEDNKYERITIAHDMVIQEKINTFTIYKLNNKYAFVF